MSDSPARPAHRFPPVRCVVVIVVAGVLSGTVACTDAPDSPPVPAGYTVDIVPTPPTEPGGSPPPVRTRIGEL